MKRRVLRKEGERNRENYIRTEILDEFRIYTLYIVDYWYTKPLIGLYQNKPCCLLFGHHKTTTNSTRALSKINFFENKIIGQSLHYNLFLSVYYLISAGENSTSPPVAAICISQFQRVHHCFIGAPREFTVIPPLPIC